MPLSKNDVINWLNEGQEFVAANFLKNCDLSMHYEDTSFSLSSGPDLDHFYVQIHCPRFIYDSLASNKDKTDKVEEAIRTLAFSLNVYAKDFQWLAKVPTNNDNNDVKLSALSKQALAKVITGDEQKGVYRSGPMLVSFFNKFLERDEYGKGFPTRIFYAQQKIELTSEKNVLRDVIEEAFDPRHFFEKNFDVQTSVDYLNSYLKFDSLQLIKIGEFYKIKSSTSSTIESKLFEISSEINLHYVEEHILKCDKKVNEGDYSGAITNARSMVENVLLAFEDHFQASETKYNGDLNKLYSRVYKMLNLDPANKEINGSMREMLTGLISLVNGLSGLRNTASDAHGARYKPQLHHAKLAVNSAKTISDFLVESFKYQKEKGLIG